MAKKSEIKVDVTAEEVSEVMEPCVVYINGKEYKVEQGKQVLPEMVKNVLHNAGKL